MLLISTKMKALIDRRVSEDVAAGRVGGAAILVVQNGKNVYRQCFGKTAPNGDVPVTDQTVFRLASMTKPITAVAALIAVERGLLSLDDPISTYLPQYSHLQIARIGTDGSPILQGEAKTPVSVRHLLCHASGIGSGALWQYYAAKMTEHDRATLANSVDYYASVPIEFEPYSKQAYSPTAAFDVVARIIELVTGQEYGAFLKKEIFDPCRMGDTTFSPSDEQWMRMIAMHDYREGKSVSAVVCKDCIFENYPTTHALAGAGLASTLHDYANFAQMLLNGGAIFGSRILTAQSVARMATKQIDDPMSGRSHWGLGVRVITKKDDILPVGTFGWSGAYGTHFWIDPQNHIFAIYLKNSRYDGGSGAITSLHFEQDVYRSYN